MDSSRIESDKVSKSRYTKRLSRNGERQRVSERDRIEKVSEMR